MCLMFMVACLCYVIFLSHIIIDARLETLTIGIRALVGDP